MATGPRLPKRPRPRSYWPKCEHCGARKKPDADPIADALALKLKLKLRAAKFLKAALLSDDPVEAIDASYATMVRRAGIQLETVPREGYRLTSLGRAHIQRMIPNLQELIHG